MTYVTQAHYLGLLRLQLSERDIDLVIRTTNIY